MVKILIVEDERIERETLLLILKENLEECSIIAARNAKEAISIFEKVHPNIVCADVNMPGMNGLDMIREMKSKNTNTEFLLVSSYDYFEYAQQAIRLGVADFILKPYHINEIVESIKTIIQKSNSLNENNKDVDETNMQKQMYSCVHECLYAIISDVSEVEVLHKVRAIDSRITSGFCVLYRGSEELHLLQQLDLLFPFPSYQVIQDHFHGFLTCFVFGVTPFSKEDMDRVCTHFETNVINEEGLGIGTFVNDIVKLSVSFLKARDHVGRKLPYPQQIYHCYSIVGDDSNRMHTYVEGTQFALEQLDEVYIKRLIKDICNDVLLQDKEDIFTLMDEYYKEVLLNIKQQYTDIDLHDFILLPLRFSTNVYQELEMNLTLNLKKLNHEVHKIRFRNTNHLVKEALYFIEHNYKRAITLSELAQHLNVSPFYISKLLSTTMHMTFTEMLARRRVEVSKELLRGSTQIKEIVVQVGFQGQSYFNKIFKKYTGLTPKVYRNKMKQ